MNKFCDNCLHYSVCGKEGCGDPAMVFCDDMITGAIPIEWLKQWEEKHKNDPCYCGFVSEEIIKDWEKENEIDDLLPNCVKHAKVMKEIENQLEERNGK